MVPVLVKRSCLFAPIVDDNGWEIVDKERRWSDAVDTSLFHEHFIAVPGYGDATLLVEQVLADFSLVAWCS